MQLAVVTASYVGRESDYSYSLSAWNAAERRVVNAYSGPAYLDRFRDLMGLIRSLGFTGVEIWNPHLPPSLNEETLAGARSVLRDLGLTPVAYYFALARPDFPRACAEQGFRMAKALGVNYLVGSFHPANRALALELCRKHGVKMAIENHFEPEPGALIDLIGADTDCFGVAVDTGWWATQRYDAVRAVRELKAHLWHVHLKDVRAFGGHDSCAYGDGVVDVRGVVAELVRMGYNGCVAVEHEPEHYDPTDELRRCLTDLRSWLGSPAEPSAP
ncbi:MAG TPA: sugar phosphate isomerase/epimerase [Symbiobacteriaceae bacterium]|nr:sugar phosphate isomerase/epimerase [Symbiobacteriaceae bacterium]